MSFLRVDIVEQEAAYGQVDHRHQAQVTHHPHNTTDDERRTTNDDDDDDDDDSDDDGHNDRTPTDGRFPAKEPWTPNSLRICVNHNTV